jgi:hypothetical protein
MVGGAALGHWLDSSEISHVTAIGRRGTGLSHPKLQEVQHSDFSDCRSISDTLSDCDIALFCLGVYTRAVPDEEFRKTTVDYTVEFAGALHERSPDAVFCFLSGGGADQTETSRMSFARYKGAAEKALLVQTARNT